MDIPVDIYSSLRNASENTQISFFIQTGKLDCENSNFDELFEIPFTVIIIESIYSENPAIVLHLFYVFTWSFVTPHTLHHH